MKRFYKKNYLGYIKIYSKSSDSRENRFYCNIRAYFLLKQNGNIFIQWKTDGWLEENLLDEYKNSMFKFLNSESSYFFQKDILMINVIKEDDKIMDGVIKLKIYSLNPKKT
jgi:hypothetical protein